MLLVQKSSQIQLYANLEGKGWVFFIWLNNVILEHELGTQFNPVPTQSLNPNESLLDFICLVQ